jgi:hypothetical protein
MNENSFNLINDFTMLFLAIGFIGFLFMISPGFRKMLKRNKKIRAKHRRLKENSKARDFQI